MTKPRLFLIKEPTAEDIVKLYEKLTGRKATPDEMREVREELSKSAGGNDLSSPSCAHEAAQKRRNTQTPTG